MNQAWLDKLNWTLSELNKLKVRYPADQSVVSSIDQVQYLIDLAEGKKEDDSMLDEIILGHHAMYSLADIISYDLSVAMCDISERVRRQLRQMGRILNIDRGDGGSTDNSSGIR